MPQGAILTLRSSGAARSMSHRHILALVRSHVDGDPEAFYAAVLQSAAHEAQQGNDKLARQLRDLAERSRPTASLFGSRPIAPTVPLAQPRGELAGLVFATYPETRLGEVVLSPALHARLGRVVREQREIELIEGYGLRPRRKLLLAGPPGTGKTMSASAIAGELRLPLFTVQLEGLITKFLGETAQKLRSVFEAMGGIRGVYFFDEFDALGSKRGAAGEVGEMRRVLNSFLQLLEQDRSQSIVVAATNHPELLDRALFRRFDDVLRFELPSMSHVEPLVRARLANFDVEVDWPVVAAAANGLAQAEIVSAADDAAKDVVLERRPHITTDDLLSGLEVRKGAHHSNW